MDIVGWESGFNNSAFTIYGLGCLVGKGWWKWEMCGDCRVVGEYGVGVGAEGVCILD